jgi:hypothetical protein
MFLLASRCLRESKGQPEESLFLEVLLLHTRVLRDFFLAVGGRIDDVLITDFLHTKPRFKLRHLRAPATKKRLDKLLAHASFTRPRLGKKWPVGMIQQEVLQAWMLFMRELEKEDPKARAWFPGYIVKRAPLA